MSNNPPTIQEIYENLLKYKFVEYNEKHLLNKSKFFYESMDLVLGNKHFNKEFKCLTESTERIAKLPLGSDVEETAVIAMVSLIQLHLERQEMQITDLSERELSTMTLGLLLAIGGYTKNGYKLRKV